MQGNIIQRDCLDTATAQRPKPKRLLYLVHEQDRPGTDSHWCLAGSKVGSSSGTKQTNYLSFRLRFVFDSTALSIVFHSPRSNTLIPSFYKNILYKKVRLRSDQN